MRPAKPFLGLVVHSVGIRFLKPGCEGPVLGKSGTD